MEQSAVINGLRDYGDGRDKFFMATEEIVSFSGSDIYTVK